MRTAKGAAQVLRARLALSELARLLRPGGRIAVVSQPRSPGATAATSAAVANELAGLLSEAGFEHLRTEMLDLDPPTACVLGHVAPADIEVPVSQQMWHLQRY